MYNPCTELFNIHTYIRVAILQLLICREIKRKDNYTYNSQIIANTVLPNIVAVIHIWPLSIITNQLMAIMQYLILTQVKYHIQQDIQGELLWFLLNRECFTSNSLLAIGIRCPKELLPQKFSCEHSFSILTTKVSPLKCFAVYSTSVQLKL